jgi:hypothetical protein
MVIPLALIMGACTALVKLGAQAPSARTQPLRLAHDPRGNIAGVTMYVDLYNPNPITLTLSRFDYRIEAGNAVAEGSSIAEGTLPPHTWRRARLFVPLHAAPALAGRIKRGEPYMVGGALVLDGAVDGLAVGVAGEGVSPASGRTYRVAIATVTAEVR